MRTVPVALAALLAFASCVEEPNVSVPEFGASNMISETYPLPEPVRKRFDGIYDVIAGNRTFGDQVVMKWNGRTVSVFTSESMVYLIFQVGYLDSIVILEGHWRNLQNLQTGLARMTIKKNEGGREFIFGEKCPAGFVMRGSYGEGSSLPNGNLTFRFRKPLKGEMTDFHIFGHRGGGRTTDLLPASENSLGILLLAEQYGCNAVEIDVRLTRDGVPVLYHDEYFSSRLVNSDFLTGPIAGYTLRQIRSFCTLKDGSPLPTLREALDVILYQTKISLVWLDTKALNLMDVLFPIQKEYAEKARAVNRKLELLIGIPSREVMDEFIRHPDHAGAPSICELGLSDVRRCGASYWGPRWTLGTLNADVAAMHGENRRAVVWTVDDPKFIRVFVREATFDGAVTNYPTRFAWEYYMKMNADE